MAAESWTWMVLIVYDSKKKGRWHIYWRQVTKCKGLFEVFLAFSGQHMELISGVALS